MEERIGIAGLGRVGGIFMDGLVGSGIPSFRVVAVADPGQPAIKELAVRHGIRVYDDALDLLRMHHAELDVLFDLTGRPDIRQQMRGFLAQHPCEMVVASEVIARMVWRLLGAGRPLPDVHARTGY